MIKKIRIKPVGMGDVIDNFTTVTGIKTVVKTVSNALGIEDCGCNKRKDKLNELLPFKQDSN